MNADVPTFLTNHELDVFLGGGERGARQRLRLQQDARVLPSPAKLGRVRRYNISLFPRFALVGLVGTIADVDGARECLTELSNKAFGLVLFGQFSEAVRESARELTEWRFDDLVREVGERATPALDEWNQFVLSSESELQTSFGIGFASLAGVVDRVHAGVCVVTADDGSTMRVPRERIPTTVEKGRAVAVERVRVLDSEMVFVLPRTTPAVDAAELELRAWFAQQMAPAPVRPYAAPEDASRYEAIPYKRRAPRSARRRGGGAMTRLPLAG